MNPGLLPAILAATVPTLAIILGIVLSRNDYHHLREEIAGVRTQQHADMLRIYELFGEHAERIVKLETQTRGR
jgi:hypothetical protein